MVKYYGVINLRKEIFDYEKSIYAMMIKFIDNLSFLDDNKKSICLKLALAYKNNLDELYKAYDYLNSEELEFIDSKKLVKINKTNDILIVDFKNSTFEISTENIKKVIAGIIDILEDVLPMGTIIELKPQFIKSMYKSQSLKEVPKFIITKRFLSKKDSLSYFPYAAVQYPIGETSKGKNIHFTSKAIDKVIYKGFSDETELAYICVMKSEMIFKKEMHSISFSTLEEREEYISN